MRKLFILFAALFAFAACTQNEVEEFSADRADVPETLTVGFEGGDTRIELNEALKTVWTAGDEVSVFYRSDINQRWQYQGETGERVGDLRCVDAGSGTPTETTKVVIAYPYDEAYYLNSETCDIQAMLPAVQGYKVSSYGEGGNIMVSQSEYNQFSLKSVVGWLRVELTGEGQMVESITLRGNAGEQVAGELYIDTTTAEATLASERGEAGEGAGGSLIFDDTISMEVTLDCGSGVELGSEATAFYIALPPQTFAEGMTIEVNCAGYKPMILSTESSITIERNHIVPMEAVEHKAGVILPSNELWYTATEKVEPSNTSAFNVTITSNEWDEATGEGIITFNGELTTIGGYAFLDCPSLTSVTIPDSVTTIGDRALRNCSSLTSVTIGDSVTTIGNEAFFNCSSLTSVTIPDSVTTIGSGTFASCHSLAEFKGKFAADEGRCLIKDNAIIAYAEASGTTYTIPDSVTTIGVYAFNHCESLTSVTIPDSVTTIGDLAFAFCESLTSVYCEATTPPTLSNFVFDDNASGRKIYVTAESVKAYKAAEKWSEYAANIVGYNFETGEVVAISNKLFYTATENVEPYDATAFNVSIVSNEWNETTGEGVITFDDELTTIGVQAFAGCSSLRSVTIPDSVTTIGDYAFSDCYSLTSVTIGDSVTTIGEYAFYICSSLTSVTIGDSVTTIGDQAFDGCSSLTSVTIPDSVTTIGYSAFNGCSSLTSVTIGNSVTTIGKVAFASCYSLAEFKGKFAADGGRCLVKDNTLIAYAEASDTTYTIPNSVTTIEEYAFADCRSLTSVTIPDSVTTIGDSAFYLCGSLTSVYCEATTPPTFGGSSVFDANVAARKIYVPAESVEAYKAATNWSDYAADIVGYNFETGEVVAISNKLFYTATALVEPNTSAFNVTIASNEWNEATGEGVITFEGELTTIGYRAFYWCDSLTSVTIGDSVTTIGEQAFRNCISLTSVTIPDSVTTIGNNAFDWCYSLTSVTIPDSVTTIGEQAFYGCSSLAEFKGKFAADEGRCLIVDRVLNVFAIGCGVAEYTIPDSVTTIGRSVFESCNSLTSVTIPDSVTTIGHYAFYNCGNLTSVTIPDSVTTIGNYAFQNCSNLTSVYCKATTPPTLGDSYVFNANADGRKIYVPATLVDDYKSAENWSEYAADIVGYNFETGEEVAE